MSRGERDSAAEFRRVRQVFEQAVDLPTTERAEFVRRECRDDAALQSQVEQLLACDDEACDANGLLDRGADVIVSGDDLAVGGRIDSFRLSAVLGSGGMGTVYEAEQDEPRRRVALKVLSLGLASQQAVRRFRFEAEVLARLQHPGIAQVYAVGVYRSGSIELPWFAMELVRGAADLISYADANNLSLSARIELLLQACDAVHHGHLHGVVHRDLKPQNLLVDDSGRVKVIDFGVARSTEQSVEARLTQPGLVFGTLQYMSPEQLESANVDLRSDIYALGGIAFELVAGRRAFVFEQTTPLAVAEALSTREPPLLGSVVRGVDRDLEAVIHQALRREPDDRYGSVAEFAADLRAFLAARPVRARGASAFYHVRMFARRRKGLVAAIATILLLLVGGLLVVVYQNIELRRGEQLTRRVAKFARDFLAESGVQRTKGVDYTVREALDLAAASIADEVFEDPRIEIELRELIGETYLGLALPDEGRPHLQRAIDLLREIEGADGRNTIRMETSMVILLQDLGQTEAAKQLLADVERRAAAALTTEDVEWWRVQHNRAWLMRHDGQWRDAELVYRDVVAARERLLGTDAEETIVSLHNLANLVAQMGRPQEGQELLQEALDRARRAGHSQVSIWQIADNLAEIWAGLGDFERAAKQHREAMDGFTQLLGPDHQLTLGCGYHLLKALYRLQQFDRVDELGTDLLARCERAFGSDDSRTMDVLMSVSAAQVSSGREEVGKAGMRRAYHGLVRVKGGSHPDSINAGNNLVAMYLHTRDIDPALATTEALVGALQTDADSASQLPTKAVGLTWYYRAFALYIADDKDRALPAAKTAHQHALADMPANEDLAHLVAELIEVIEGN